MTDLEKSPVTRRSSSLYKGRRLIVTLRSDDVIEIRPERSRDVSEKIKIPIRGFYELEMGIRSVLPKP